MIVINMVIISNDKGCGIDASVEHPKEPNPNSPDLMFFSWKGPWGPYNSNKCMWLINKRTVNKCAHIQCVPAPIGTVGRILMHSNPFDSF